MPTVRLVKGLSQDLSAPRSVAFLEWKLFDIEKSLDRRTQTPPTTTNSTSWRASTFRIAEKSATLSAIPGFQHGLHVTLQYLKAFFRGL